jgi:hypothetical protein
MVQVIDHPANLPPAEAAAGTTLSDVLDRRRPGRVEHIGPTLIPLLRAPAQFVDTELDMDADPLVAARGMAVAVLLSVPLWALVGLVAWLTL